MKTISFSFNSNASILLKKKIQTYNQKKILYTKLNQAKALDLDLKQK